jgi:hypothetical protein
VSQWLRLFDNSILRVADLVAHDFRAVGRMD